MYNKIKKGFTGYTPWGILANMMKKAIYVMLAVALGAAFYWWFNDTAEAPMLAEVEKPETYRLSASTSTIQVVGMVEAADSAIIAAKTSGVIQSIPVYEGLTVWTGQLLASQETPVATARVAYSSAQAAQSNVEYLSAVDAQSYMADKAASVAYSAETLAVLRDNAATESMQSQVGAVRVGIESGVTTMLDTLAYVSDNPALFDDPKREQFYGVVSNLYGQVPAHFRGGLAPVGGSDSADALKTLESLRAIDTAELSAFEVQTLGVVVMGQLRAMMNLYVGAESDVLDRRQTAAGGSEYNEYFTNRAAVIAALEALETAYAGLQSSIDNAAVTAASGEQSVAVSDIDKENAERQAEFSERIAAAAANAPPAAEAVAYAEQSLGDVTAPFSGVVAEVLKEPGEYANPGEPILKLVGSGAREVTVSVPVSVASGISVGTPFINDGKVVGTVSRFGPVQTGHSYEVVIELTADAQVGSSMAGELQLSLDESVMSVPREYVFFAQAGPYVMDEDGEHFPLTIEQDNGVELLVSFTAATPYTALVSNRSIQL